jgi:hypothetical protein
MKRNRLFSVTLSGFLCAASPALADWQYTKWNMTIDQVQRASGNRLRQPTPQEQRDYTVNGTPPGLVGQYDTGTFQFRASFYFSVNGNLLSRAYLHLNDYTKARSLLDAMRGQYGNPLGESRSMGAATMRWRDEKNGNEIEVFDMAGNFDVTYAPLTSGKGL